MPSIPVLLIRTDASERIGTGHVMRMIALAQAWRRRGGFVQFYCCECPGGLSDRLSNEGFYLHRIDAVPGSAPDQKTFSDVCREANKACVVLDGYHFDVEYQSAIKAESRTLLVVDDYGHLDRYDCDILLNQNPGSDTLGLEAKAPGAKLLLGLKYALLREEFLNTDPSPKSRTDGPINLLITMGGSDPDNVTNLVLDSLKPHSEKIAQARILLGAANPHLAELDYVLPLLPYEAKILVNSTEMPAHLAWADAAITAGGSTCWELAYMGVPMAVVVLAENQYRIAMHLGLGGFALNLGWYQDLNAPALGDSLFPFINSDVVRRGMAAKAKSQVDRKGSARVCASLRASAMNLRPASTNDSKTLWELANDPAVRAASFLSAPIPWGEHDAWFQKKLADVNAHILIAFDEASDFMGVVRFECGGDNVARISVAVAPESRGGGTGAALIVAGADWLFAHTFMTRIDAFIRPGNLASISAFQTAGFYFVGETVAHGEVALKYERQSPSCGAITSASLL